MSHASAVGGFEPLESRRLFSIITMPGPGPEPSIDVLIWQLQTTPTVTSKGTLVIQGTDRAETFTVTRKGANFQVFRSAGGNPYMLSVTNHRAAAVKRIYIDAGDGADRVGVALNVNRRCTILGGAGRDTIDGGPGDTILGGGENDKLFARPIDPTLDASGAVVTHAAPEGPASVNGGAGDDTIVACEDDFITGGPGRDYLWYQSFMPVVGGNELQFRILEWQRLIGNGSGIPEGIEEPAVWVRIVTPTGVQGTLG